MTGPTPRDVDNLEQDGSRPTFRGSGIGVVLSTHGSWSTSVGHIRKAFVGKEVVGKEVVGVHAASWWGEDPTPAAKYFYSTNNVAEEAGARDQGFERLEEKDSKRVCWVLGSLDAPRTLPNSPW